MWNNKPSANTYNFVFQNVHIVQCSVYCLYQFFVGVRAYFLRKFCEGLGRGGAFGGLIFGLGYGKLYLQYFERDS